MKEKILVTGGCGFIGSHLVDRLVKEGYKVKVYDLLEPQVHLGKKPNYLNKEAEYIFADIRDKNKLKKALEGMDIVFHEAAQVGVGQSMYQIQKYVSHNSEGTAVLLDLLVNMKNKLKKMIVASSMSIYGEGAYKCEKCGVVYPHLRTDEQLKGKDWEMRCPKCKKKVGAIPTSEEKPLLPTSVYATTKHSQEELCLEIGRTYRIPTVSLRYFNVYGPRQSLSNPYTGVMAIFISRIKNNNYPVIYEDGNQTRDFVSVYDIVQANLLAMEKEEADYEFFNVGTGKPISINTVIKELIKLFGKNSEMEITNKFRKGDIRHCIADISKIKEKLGFKPKILFEDGLKELIEWSENEVSKDFFDRATKELIEKKIV